MRMTNRITKQISAILLAIAILCSCFISFKHINAEQNDARPLVVVSLGDSYSSGEGIEPFYGQDKALDEKVKDEDWLAHRSTKGWPALLQFSGIAGKTGDYNVKYDSSSVVNWYFAAVSGATTEHISKATQTKVYNKSQGSSPISPFNLTGSVELPKQIDVFNGIEGTVDYVTMSIGGNDVKFADIITTCALHSSWLHFGKPKKLQEEINAIWENFDKTRSNIEQVYCDISEKAGPNAWIIVAGYPKLLDKDGRGALISKAEAQLVNENVVKFNNEIRAIVEKCSRNGMNIEFVDVIAEFDKDGGHQAYSKNPWINKIMFFANSEDLDDASIASSYSVHPNELGAKAYARCVNAKIKEIEAKKKTGTLRGVLFDSNNPEQPIENAILCITKGAYNYKYDVDGGMFSLTLPAGDYSIEIVADNYIKYTSEVVIQDESVVDLNIGLELNAVPVVTNQFNGNEYAVYDIPMTWSRAESFCESLGGHLVCISSEAENEFVLNLISAGSKNLYWLGGSRINNSSDWGWVTGESTNYFNWGNNKPDNYDSVEDKLQMYRNSINNNPVGSWNDASDSGAGYHSEFYELNNTGFVCEWGISSMDPVDDDFAFSEHRYEVFTIQSIATWEQAKEYCEAVGGHLATITSAEENEYVYQLMLSQGINSAYFGYSDAENEGMWVWVTKESSSYTNWHSGEPNSENTQEDYAMFYHQFSDGTWNDGRFGAGSSFICEWEDGIYDVWLEFISGNGWMELEEVQQLLLDWFEGDEHALQCRIVDLDGDGVQELVIYENLFYLTSYVTVWKYDPSTGEIKAVEFINQDNPESASYVLEACDVYSSILYNAIVITEGRPVNGWQYYTYYTLQSGKFKPAYVYECCFFDDTGNSSTLYSYDTGVKETLDSTMNAIIENDIQSRTFEVIVRVSDDNNVPPQDGSIELTDYIDGIGADITSRMAEVAALLQGVIRTNNAEYPDACYEGNGILLGYNDEWGFFCIIDRNPTLKVYPVEIGMSVDQVESAFSYLPEGWYRINYDNSNSTIRVSIGDSEFYVLNYDSDGRITRIQYSIEYSG